MRLAIDVREACRQARTGKGQWVRGCVTELLGRSLSLTLLTDLPLPPAWRAFPVDVLRFPPGFRWHWKAARFLIAQRRAIDAYVSPTSFVVPCLAGGALPCVPVVHDLIAFRKEPDDRRAQRIERWTLPSAARRAAHLCTVSDATRRDLLERFPFLPPSRVSAIYAGPLTADPPPNQPDGSTILSAGTLSPRKNQRRLILAYQALPEDLRSRFRLVLAGGRGWDDAEIIRLAERTPGVQWLGHVPDAEYERLLGSCTVFAFPSLYEGFGLPVLDALQRGAPVLTSSRGSLMEVAGAAALTVDPENTASIASGLERLLRDDALRLSLREKGPGQARTYRWSRTADLLLGALSGLHA